jgi:hypothetical protein
MFDPDFIKQYIKHALGKSLRDGSTTFIEEMLESLTNEQLETGIRLLQKILLKRKKPTVVMPSR